MSSDSKWNIKHDRNEDVIFEREPKGWNEEEDEEGEPNVSLKWKSLKLQDYKESEKDSVKQTGNGKKITLFALDVDKIISFFYHRVCSQIGKRVQPTLIFYRKIRLYRSCRESFIRQFKENRWKFLDHSLWVYVFFGVQTAEIRVVKSSVAKRYEMKWSEHKWYEVKQNQAHLRKSPI